MSPMQKIISTTLVSALAALGLVACGKAPSAPEPVRAVRTVKLGESSLGGHHDYAGEVRAKVESRLGFRVGGKLLTRSVHPGDVVKAGQLLAQLDGQDLLLGRDAAQAALQAARTNRDLAAADFKRFADLRAQGFISAAELERREASLKAAQAQFDQASAQAAAQGNQAAYASLKADAPGVIMAVHAEPGMVLSAGSPVLTLAHDGPREVVFSVPEDKVDALRAAAAQPGGLSVNLWAQGAQRHPAKLRELSGAADPLTRTFQARVTVDQLPARLGQTATVRVEAPAGRQAIKLPLTAVLNQGGKTVVWVLDPSTMTVNAQPVQVAGADGNEAVIGGGLKPGQEVVTAGVHVLTPGLKVTRYQAPAAAAQ